MQKRGATYWKSKYNLSIPLTAILNLLYYYLVCAGLFA